MVFLSFILLSAIPERREARRFKIYKNKYIYIKKNLDFDEKKRGDRDWIQLWLGLCTMFVVFMEQDLSSCPFLCVCANNCSQQPIEVEREERKREKMCWSGLCPL